MGPPPNGSTNLAASSPPPGVRDNRPREGGGRWHRPFWLRGLDESELQSLIAKQTLHGLALTMSTEGLEAATRHDLWLRTIIVLLATVSALGSGLAWRNLATSSELQIRLVRASEMNTHLKEMNLAAAGLAHETRNPLNIIRGLAQTISKQPSAGPEMEKRSREIIEEADKVAAQLNEFINYSRPREVRRSRPALGSDYAAALVAPAKDIGGITRQAFVGQSTEFRAKMHNPANPLEVPTDLSPIIRAFTVNIVPEPSGVALGLIGAGALLLLRRRK